MRLFLKKKGKKIQVLPNTTRISMNKFDLQSLEQELSEKVLFKFIANSI